MLTLFPLKLGSLNIFLLKTFRARQRQSVSIRLINVDMMREPRFPGLCLDGVMQYCLPYNMKTLISKIKRQISGNEVVHCDITNTVSAHANPVVWSRIVIPDFLLETITVLIAHWWKIKNILNKIFSNPLFKMMSCVWIKILFIECKYFGLNTNIFYWMQIYFLKYQIFFIEYKYFFIKSKYIFLNIKYFSLNTNIFY